MKKLGIIILIVGVVGIAYWLISPLFIDVELNESLDPKLAQVLENVDPEMRDEFMQEMEAMPKEQMVEDSMPENEPQLIAVGSFVDVEHEGSGKVKVIDVGNTDGAIVRFEELDVLNGPDLRVVLSKQGNIQSSNELGDYIELGRLKGNKGNQNYAVPADIDMSEYKSVVIYCKAFHVVFNSADLQ